MTFHGLKLPRTKKAVRPSIEMVVAYLLVSAVGTMIFRDPGFVSWFAVPHFLVPLVFGAFYGPWGAVVAWGLALGLVGTELVWTGSPVPQAMGLAAAGALLATGAVLFFRSIILQQRRSYRSRFREIISQNHRLRRENLALTEVSRQLEVRLSRQKRFLTFLLAKLNALDHGDLDRALNEILDIVRTFAGAEKASLWHYEPAEHRLVLVASLGWSEAEKRVSVLSSEGTIPGWVCRNGTPFSLRMGVTQDHFRKMDRGDNLLTYPLRIGNRVWGALNIEAMPFVQYSRYTETVIEIILNLAEKSLKPLLDRELFFSRQEVHPKTGLPLPTLLFKVLGEELGRIGPQGGLLSVVVLEVANSEELEARADGAGFLKLLGQLAALVRKETGPAVEVFHYRQDNQLAFYLSGRDTDGTALFCLNLLSVVHEHPWTLADGPVFLEVLVGYDTYREGVSRPEDLLDHAERLVQMQRS